MTNEFDDVKRREDRRALRALMAYPEWQTLTEYLQRFREIANINLVAIKKDVPDDFLRGQIQAYGFVLWGLAEQLDLAEREELQQLEVPSEGPPYRGDPYGEPTSLESE